jgi:hypothetical protein
MWKPNRFFTPAEVEAAMTPKGGFSRASLAKLGVPWPPPSGWRKAITIHSEAVQLTSSYEPSRRTPSEWAGLLPCARFLFRKREL